MPVTSLGTDGVGLEPSLSWFSGLFLFQNSCQQYEEIPKYTTYSFPCCYSAACTIVLYLF